MPYQLCLRQAQAPRSPVVVSMVELVEIIETTLIKAT